MTPGWHLLVVDQRLAVAIRGGPVDLGLARIVDPEQLGWVGEDELEKFLQADTKPPFLSWSYVGLPSGNSVEEVERWLSQPHVPRQETVDLITEAMV